jgi:hypothetical protein
MRYELQGETRVAFDLDDAGRPVQPRIERTSGWRLLDRMSERAVASCRYAPAAAGDATRSNLKVNFVWKLGPRADEPTAAALVEGSCTPSAQFGAFQALRGKATEGDGVLVRFLLDAAGKPFGLRTEGATAPDVYQAAEAFVASCRFTPASWKGAPGPGNLVGRLLPPAA